MLWIPYVYPYFIVQVPKGDKSSVNEIIMVDPLEAKKLAAKQMEQIKAREKFKVKFHSLWMIKICKSEVWCQESMVADYFLLKYW